MDLLKDYTGQNLNFVTSKRLLYKLNEFQKSNLILLQNKTIEFYLQNKILKKDCLNLARENTTVSDSSIYTIPVKLKSKLLFN